MGFLCENIYKSYEGKNILKGVSFELKAGEITVLIGPSGIGKSTLLKCATMIEKPDKGNIIINSKNKKIKFSFPQKNGSINKIYPFISVVFQQLHLWPHLTLRNNILLPLGVKSDLDLSNEKKLLFDKFVNKFEITNHLDKYPNESSIGQRQRVAIIRALVLEPEFLFLDEVTSALDVEQVAILLDVIKDIAKKGIGVFIITHLLGFAKRTADKIFFLDKGILSSLNLMELNGTEIIEDRRIHEFINILTEVS